MPVTSSNLENSLATLSLLVFQLAVADSEAPGQEAVSHKLEGAWVPCLEENSHQLQTSILNFT